MGASVGSGATGQSRGGSVHKNGAPGGTDIPDTSSRAVAYACSSHRQASYSSCVKGETKTSVAQKSVPCAVVISQVRISSVSTSSNLATARKLKATAASSLIRTHARPTFDGGGGGIVTSEKNSNTPLVKGSTQHSVVFGTDS